MEDEKERGGRVRRETQRGGKQEAVRARLGSIRERRVETVRYQMYKGEVWEEDH